MQITAFRVERFRSIKTASLDLRDLTVLVGPNNEGKSNILRAMVLGMSALRGFATTRLGPKYRVRAGLRGPVDYDWDRDFPVDLRESARKTTSLEFSFQLDVDEIEEFSRIIGSKINGDLRVALTFSRDATVSFRVIKQRVGKKWSQKAGEIAEFIGSRIGVEYVQSVRTASEASLVVSRLVAAELRTLERDPAYQKALATIEDLQAPILQEIAASVRETLEHFLPKVVGVEVMLAQDRARVASARDVEVMVDDGRRTPLEMKGDGVQSLAAVALLRRWAMDRSKARMSVLAVEEPEAHLHPLAIRELRRVLTQIAGDQQVVVTTHSPLFADPLRVDRNVIVEGNTARVATKIADVRDCLGVRLEDNLQSARLALIVEGAADVKILRAILPTISTELAADLESGALVIEGLGGGGKLNYRLSQYSSGVCSFYVLLDNDQQGRDAIASALAGGLLVDADYRLVVADGKTESELEDLLDPQCYVEAVNTLLGLDLAASAIRKGRAKWSSRIESLVSNSGKLWSKNLAVELKTLVADSVVETPSSALLANVDLIHKVAEHVTARLHS